MSKDIIVLGTGCSSSITQHNASIAIENQGKLFLIDCGYTATRALHEQGFSMSDVEAIFITHVHADHVYGLERFGCESFFAGKEKMKLFLREELIEELWDQTLKGTMGKIAEGEMSLDDYFDVHTLAEGEKFSYFDCDFEVFEVSHTPNKKAYGININNEVFYSGDTNPIPNTIAQYPFDIGFHDTMLADWNPVHATTKELIEQYPLDIRKKLYLISYEDDWQDHTDSVNDNFAGFARPGMRIKLKR